MYDYLYLSSLFPFRDNVYVYPLTKTAHYDTLIRQLYHILPIKHEEVDIMSTSTSLNLTNIADMGELIPALFN